MLPANSTDTLAKLQAQKGNQVIDRRHPWMTAVMYQAIQLGFCTKIEGMDKSEPLSCRPVQGRQGGRRRPDRYRLHGQPPKVPSRKKAGAIPTSWNDLKGSQVHRSSS